METKRQKQLGQDIQRILARAFTDELKDVLQGAFVTVADVKLTPDLMTARAYITVFEKQKERLVLSSMHENLSRLRGVVGNRLKNKVRRIPTIEVFLDHSLQKVFEIENLLKNGTGNNEEE
mgnify:CR=1 FL=1